MYLYQTGAIANTATAYKPIQLREMEATLLLDFYIRSVLMAERNTGDVTIEDLRLTKEEVLRRMTHTSPP